MVERLSIISCLLTQDPKALPGLLVLLDNEDPEVVELTVDVCNVKLHPAAIVLPTVGVAVLTVLFVNLCEHLVHVSIAHTDAAASL
jgi:hypothetical protein